MYPAMSVVFLWVLLKNFKREEEKSLLKWVVIHLQQFCSLFNSHDDSLSLLSYVYFAVYLFCYLFVLFMDVQTQISVWFEEI